MFNMFKRSKKVENKIKKPQKSRRFVGASNGLSTKFQASYQKINGELKSDFIALTTRARDLAKNNQTVNSYINLMLRSVLGNVGFILNSTCYNEDGSSDRIANAVLQNHWYEYTKSYKKYVSADNLMNGLDFDRHILFNFLVDGEVFIRKVKDSTSPYGIRFEVLDSLQIDPLYNAENSATGEKIVMGIKVDSHYKPLSYFYRKNSSADYYLSGQREEIKASEIIHLYRKQYADQVRGFTPLSAVLLDLNSLETYKRAQINAAQLNSSYMGIWEKQGSGDSFGDFDENDVDENGDVAVELESNVFRYAPDGYKLSQIASNHPNSNVGSFCKAILKGVAGALGMSYNKISSDYQSTSYSSLRQSNIEDEIAVKQLQQFIIDNWKNLQFAEWLKYLLISDLTNLPYSKLEKFMSHQFTARNFEYLDPAKELQSIQIRLSLGLSSPIEEIKNLGKSPEDVLDEWGRWNQMLKDRGLKIASTMQMLENAVDHSPEDKNDEEIIEE